MNNRLAPSILSGDFTDLGSQIRAIEAAGATDLHFDVMDGAFVPNISFGIPVLKSLRPFTDLFMDAHLMIMEPARYAKPFAEAGADLITFHLEACETKEAVLETIDAIRAAGSKVGVAVNPETDGELVFPYVEAADMILVMGVHPGFGGQGLVDGTFEKIRLIRDYMNEHGLERDLQVDGGIKLNNVDQALEAGANVIVAGSAVFKGDVQANAAAFMEHMINV